VATGNTAEILQAVPHRMKSIWLD